jgi:hypothetical protein
MRVQSVRSEDSDVHGGVDARYPRGANKAPEIEHGTAGRRLSASTQWITLSCKYIGRAVSEGFYEGRK